MFSHMKDGLKNDRHTPHGIVYRDSEMYQPFLFYDDTLLET